jgi:mannose/fructose/N-acetylgalactosamine-specific phosphotransferase system component IIC
VKVGIGLGVGSGDVGEGIGLGGAVRMINDGSMGAASNGGRSNKELTSARAIAMLTMVTKTPRPSQRQGIGS